MTPEWERAQAPDARDAWEGLVAPLARELAGRSDDIAAEILWQARLEMPDLVDEPDGWDALYTALDEGARAVAGALERGDDPESLHLPPVTLAFVRETARRGVPLTPLMRVYRFVRSVLLADAIARLTEIAQGYALLVAHADDASELGAAMHRVFNDDELASDLRRKGRLRAADFSWARAADQHLALYKDVARAPRAHARESSYGPLWADVRKASASFVNDRRTSAGQSPNRRRT